MKENSQKKLRENSSGKCKIEMISKYSKLKTHITPTEAKIQQDDLPTLRKPGEIAAWNGKMSLKKRWVWDDFVTKFIEYSPSSFVKNLSTLCSDFQEKNWSAVHL